MSNGHYHLVGAAGVGMSSLAQAVQADGYEVTGSDRYLDDGHELDVIQKLRAGGITFFAQNGSGVRKDTRGVVVSTAIEKDNPDLQAAGRHGVPVIHRATMLARLAEGKRCVAITGTSGKSTTTGMVGWILQAAGMDPTVVNGAAVLNWYDDAHVGNFRAGASDLWVIEADESDRSLLDYTPDWAIITNVSLDHFPIEEATALFRTFRSQVRCGVISAIDEPRLLPEFSPVVTALGSRFSWNGVAYYVPLCGRHNAENALAAVRLCERLGAPGHVMAAALADFQGIQRRLERVGVARGVTVVDDYGHNPAKIRAAWEALAPYHSRIFAVWRPHGYGPLRAMMNDMAETFASLCRARDRIMLLPVYDAGGTATRTVQSDTLAQMLQTRGVPADYVEDYDQVMAVVLAGAHAGDVVLMMGARDPALSMTARRLVRELAP
jgi:UDP-N-acetylmuramate--alanine ligase